MVKTSNFYSCIAATSSVCALSAYLDCGFSLATKANP